MREGQLANWKRYLRDNPYRYMMRREYPDLFQRALCITIDGVRYSAFGSDYERFHYLNRLTEAVCAVSHTTDVGVHGLRHVHGGG